MCLLRGTPEEQHHCETEETDQEAGAWPPCGSSQGLKRPPQITCFLSLWSPACVPISHLKLLKNFGAYLIYHEHMISSLLLRCLPQNSFCYRKSSFTVWRTHCCLKKNLQSSLLGMTSSTWGHDIINSGTWGHQLWMSFLSPLFFYR